MHKYTQGQMKQFCDEANCLHVCLYHYSQNVLLSQTCEQNQEIIPIPVVLPTIPRNSTRIIKLYRLIMWQVLCSALFKTLQVDAKERFPGGTQGNTDK